ncbi:hypothetical protein JQX13_52005 [Archangium violaceum]|uniref:hypothetical protein n=1 Tax=Archangium violaceum TaxID=83451 RepID=UPI00193B8D40|nr:hypothetical protein [Archangium violaceum]QRK08353.1 hypothetical protein JQX13_52005 [Archangium violaceum]
MKRLILLSMLVTSGLLVTACEAEREEAVDEQEGIGGAGLREEPGEERLLEVEPGVQEREGIQEREGVQEREGIQEREGVLEND